MIQLVQNEWSIMSRVKHQPEYRLNRPIVLERDNYCCVKCESTLGLEVHHIEGYKNSKLKALATLCYLCHNIAPMGKEEFTKWILIGESGIEYVERKLSQNGLNNISRETMWKVLKVLTDLGIETNKSRMKAARDRIRQSGIRCEGVPKFGHFLEEKPILKQIIDLRTNGLSCDKIAEQLNNEKILSRRGVKWLGCTVSRILWREVPELQEKIISNR